MRFNLKKLFRKMKLSKKLTNEEKVASARNKIESAFSMFKNISDDIEEVNKELLQVVKSESEIIRDAERNRDNAEDEHAMNIALQEKLSQFIVK